MQVGGSLFPDAGHPGLNVVGRTRESSGEVLRAVLCHQDVVFDANPNAAIFFGHREIVGLEIQPRFNREDVAFLQCTEVRFVPGVRAVVHVDTQHVGDPVQGVAPVELSLGL